ncbi:MAG TPA: hypothetical protein VFB62_18500 [Polyangiaceae bacterium]|nr:hypothetical protein [Polyangiaceae bacterium]
MDVVFRFAALLVAISGCAELEIIELDRCGNGVLEPARGEDCDSYAVEPSTRCAASGEAHECRYVCTQPGTGEGCPAGWRCGVDGVCRAAAGTLATEPKVVNQSAGFWTDLADLDGDWQADIVTVHSDHAAAVYLEDAELRQSFEIPITTIGIPILAEASGDGLPDLLLPTVAGLSTLRASTERRLLPTSYASITLTGISDAHFFSADILPDVIVGLGLGASFAGEELLAVTPDVITGLGANWQATAMMTSDLGKLLPPAVGDFDEISEAGSPFLPAGSATPQEIALAFSGDTHITVLRPTLAVDTMTMRALVTLDSAPVQVALGGPVVDGVLAVQLNPPVEPSGESALHCSPTGRVPGDAHLDLLAGIKDLDDNHFVVAAFGLGDGRFHSVPCELDAVVASTIPANGAAAPVDWLQACATPVLAAGQIDDDGVLDVAGASGLWLTGLLADPFVGVCDIAAPHVAQSSASWSMARIADLDGRPPADVVGARADGGLDVLLGSTDAPHTMTHVPTLAPVAEMSVADVDANGADDVAFIERFGSGGDTLSLLFGELDQAPSAPVTLGAGGQMAALSTFDSTVIGDIVPDDASEIALAVRQGDSLAMALLWGRSDRQIHAPFLMAYPDGVRVALGGAVGRLEIDGDAATSESALFALGTNGFTSPVLGAGHIQGESHIALGEKRLEMQAEATDVGIGMLAIDHDGDGQDTPVVLVYSAPEAASSRLYAPILGANEWSLPAPLTFDGALPLGARSDESLGQLSVWSEQMSPSARACRLGEPAAGAVVALMLVQTPCATGDGTTTESVAHLFDAGVISSIVAESGGAPALLRAPPGEAMLAIDCLQADTDVGDELAVLTIAPPPPGCGEKVEAFTSLRIYLTEPDGSGMDAPVVELDAGIVPALVATNRTHPPASGIATGDANGDGVDDVAVATDTRTLIVLGKPTNP